MGTGHSRQVALYLRVSTDGQTTRNQHRELEAIAKRHGWNVVEVFRDDGVSGATGREKRPAFNKLLQGIARRRFDLVAAWSVDRLGRSLKDLVDFLTELKAKGVDLYLHQQAVDTSTPSGRALFQMLAVFAEFERALIVERVKTGLMRAKAEGKTLGRPRIDAEIEDRIRGYLAEGFGIHKTARLAGVGAGTVQRVKGYRAKVGRFHRRRRVVLEDAG